MPLGSAAECTSCANVLAHAGKHRRRVVAAFSPEASRGRFDVCTRSSHDSSPEGTGFEIPVPHYPRWSRGSPRRIGVRFDSLQERGGFAERAAEDAVEAFERLALGVQGFALTAQKAFRSPDRLEVRRLVLFDDRRKAQELP